VIWRIGQFPELEHLDARGRAAVLGHVRWWVYPVMVLRSAVAGFLAFVVAAWGMLCALDVGPDAWIAMTGGLAAFVAAYLMQVNRIRREMRLEIRRLVAQGPTPLCLACGYDLRGSPGPRCPECGEAILGQSYSVETRR